jgi:ABC-type uncharacterized transport system substrate-binding protein
MRAWIDRTNDGLSRCPPTASVCRQKGTSAARPGGNITGFFFDFPEFRTKWLQLLQEAIPRLSSVAALWDPATGPYQLKAIEEAAGVLRLNLQILEVRSPADLDPAFLAAAGLNADAVLILSSPIFGANSKVVADLALRHRLPAVTLFPDFARAGGLMAYGPNLLDSYRQLGGMVGKVLHGSKPANLPVELPYQVRAGYQSQDRQGRRRRDSDFDLAARRRGDRIGCTFAAPPMSLLAERSRGRCQ